MKSLSNISASYLCSCAQAKDHRTVLGFAITKVHLDVTISAPNADRAKVNEAANKAKNGCPVSKLFKAEITMSAKLAA